MGSKVAHLVERTPHVPRLQPGIHLSEDHAFRLLRKVETESTFGEMQVQW